MLDAGCGCGFGDEYLARSGARGVVGVDISKEAVKFARTHYSVANLDFVVMDVRHLGFKDRSFGTIVSFEVIEHLSDSQNYLKGIQRVLKTDGVYIISTPNKKVSSAGLEKPILPFHVKEFYPEELYSLLNKYFNEVHLLGKRICNEETLAKERSYKKSLQFKVVKKLSQYDSIKKVARLLPLRFKQMLTGAKKSHLKPSDFEMCNNYEEAPTLVATCKN